jgi:hypothetical protein
MMKRWYLAAALAVGMLSLFAGSAKKVSVVDIPPPFCPPFCR